MIEKNGESTPEEWISWNHRQFWVCSVENRWVSLVGANHLTNCHLVLGQEMRQRVAGFRVFPGETLHGFLAKRAQGSWRLGDFALAPHSELCSPRVSGVSQAWQFKNWCSQSHATPWKYCYLNLVIWRGAVQGDPEMVGVPCGFPLSQPEKGYPQRTHPTRASEFPL